MHDRFSIIGGASGPPQSLRLYAVSNKVTAIVDFSDDGFRGVEWSEFRRKRQKQVVGREVRVDLNAVLTLFIGSTIVDQDGND